MPILTCLCCIELVCQELIKPVFIYVPMGLVLFLPLFIGAMCCFGLSYVPIGGFIGLIGLCITALCLPAIGCFGSIASVVIIGAICGTLGLIASGIGAIGIIGLCLLAGCLSTIYCAFSMAVDGLIGCICTVAGLIAFFLAVVGLIGACLIAGCFSSAICVGLSACLGCIGLICLSCLIINYIIAFCLPLFIGAICCFGSCCLAISGIIGLIGACIGSGLLMLVISIGLLACLGFNGLICSLCLGIDYIITFGLLLFIGAMCCLGLSCVSISGVIGLVGACSMAGCLSTFVLVLEALCTMLAGLSCAIGLICASVSGIVGLIGLCIGSGLLILAISIGFLAFFGFSGLICSLCLGVDYVITFGLPLVLVCCFVPPIFCVSIGGIIGLIGACVGSGLLISVISIGFLAFFGFNGLICLLCLGIDYIITFGLPLVLICCFGLPIIGACPFSIGSAVLTCLNVPASLIAICPMAFVFCMVFYLTSYGCTALAILVASTPILALFAPPTLFTLVIAGIVGMTAIAGITAFASVVICACMIFSI